MILYMLNDTYTMAATCKYVGCNIKPKYGVEYTNLAEYCYSHAPKDYADVTVRTCIYTMCKNPATHKINKQLEFCITHAPIDAIPGYIKCLSSECSRKATYGALDINVKEYCYKHRNRKLHVKLGRKACRHIGCKKMATGRQRLYCAEHVDVTYLPTINRCIVFACKGMAYYGLPNCTAVFCVKHFDKDRHVCLRGRPCPYDKCTELIISRAKKCPLNHTVKWRLMSSQVPSQAPDLMPDLMLQVPDLMPNLMPDLDISQYFQ